MTRQAENFMQLVKGNPPSQIKRALQAVNPSVVNQLKEHCGVDNLDALAFKLC